MAKAIEIDVTSNGDYWQGRWKDTNGKTHKCSLGPKATTSKRQARKLAASMASDFAKKPGMAAMAGKAPGLADYVTRYIAGRSDLGDGSRYNYDLAGRYLRAHFGDGIVIDRITRDQARAWRAAVASGSLIDKVKALRDPEATGKADPAEGKAPSETTVCNVTKYAKAIFRQATDDDLIPFNPFDRLCSTPPEPAKDWGYIGGADLDKLISACESPGWKAFIGLCRLAGLRRSEAVALPWSGVNWAEKRLTIFASKTKASRSGGKRVVPIEPQLYKILLEAFEAAGEGRVRVADVSGNNLLRDFDVIRRRAELPEMAEPFQNMRRSRAQDWSALVPMNTLAEWMGHSIEVAATFYLTTTTDTFTKVTGGADAKAEGGAGQMAAEAAAAPKSES